MTEKLQVSDAVLGAAGAELVTAAARVLPRATHPPAGHFQSLTMIDDTVQQFNSSLLTAQAALADAAKTACAEVSSFMQQSGELDAKAAGALHSGFAVERGRS